MTALPGLPVRWRRDSATKILSVWQYLQDYDTPELRGGEWTPSDLPNSTLDEDHDRLFKHGRVHASGLSANHSLAAVLSGRDDILVNDRTGA